MEKRAEIVSITVSYQLTIKNPGNIGMIHSLIVTNESREKKRAAPLIGENLLIPAHSTQELPHTMVTATHT